LNPRRTQRPETVFTRTDRGRVPALRQALRGLVPRLREPRPRGLGRERFRSEGVPAPVLERDLSQLRPRRRAGHARRRGRRLDLPPPDRSASTMTGLIDHQSERWFLLRREGARTPRGARPNRARGTPRHVDWPWRLREDAARTRGGRDPSRAGQSDASQANSGSSPTDDSFERGRRK
jgi:hypothetical protein